MSAPTAEVDSVSRWLEWLAIDQIHDPRLWTTSRTVLPGTPVMVVTCGTCGDLVTAATTYERIPQSLNERLIASQYRYHLEPCGHGLQRTGGGPDFTIMVPLSVGAAWHAAKARARIVWERL